MAATASQHVVKRATSIVLRNSARSLTTSLYPQQGGENDDTLTEHAQQFVKVGFEPGEWDPERTDPLARPPWKNRARIMSAEDFAQRPRVGFSEEFESLHDAMVTLTWLDGKQCDAVYNKYLELMSRMGNKTSHEYVMRVVGQQFNLTAQRVAAIVQLAHNEEQLKKDGEEIRYELQDYVDSKVKEHIENAYSEYNEINPNQFVEDPFGVMGMGDPASMTNQYVVVEDTVDVKGLEEEMLLREAEEIKLAIDGKTYIEDVDESTLHVPVTDECHTLLHTQKQLSQTEQAQRSTELKPAPSHPRRPRWKYVAQVINTREAKKQKKASKKTKTDPIMEGMDNTLIEHDGELRVATLTEAKSTAWKPKRNTTEFAYQGVKKAWLERKLEGAHGVWGRQQAPEPEPEPEPIEAKDDETAEEEGDESSSSSDDESSGSDSSSDEDESEEPAEEEPPKDDADDGEKKD